MTGNKIKNIIGVLVLVPVFSFCQTSPAIRKLIDSAGNCLQKGDTAKAIYLYETIARQYPEDGVLPIIDRFVGDIYFSKQNYTEALRKYFSALNTKPANYPTIRADSSKLPSKYFIFTARKAEACIAISKTLLKQNQLQRSYYYLLLADNEYLPYKSCGNGVIMYKSYLSPFFADYYLKAGDTGRAINRLLDYFMKMDGDHVAITLKLKSTLLLKYTQQEITREIANGLDELFFRKNENDEGGYWCLPLFGYTVKYWSYCKQNSLSVEKRYLKTEQHLQYLAGINNLSRN